MLEVGAIEQQSGHCGDVGAVGSSEEIFIVLLYALLSEADWRCALVTVEKES